MKVIRDIKYGPKPLNIFDVYYPESEYSKVLVHFHGGGIESGDKCDESQMGCAEWIAKNGILAIEVDYSMYPTAKFPEFIEDVAKAVAYIKKEYAEGKELYLSGQSAGGYLSLMLCFATHYLKNEGVDPMDISGWLVDSAQTTAHFNVLREYGIDTRAQIMDEKGPQSYVNADTKFTRVKLFFYTQDMPCRYEQNMLFYKSILQFNPDANIEYEVLEGTHCSWSGCIRDGIYPICPKFLEFMSK